jgi:hypothetical protein
VLPVVLLVIGQAAGVFILSNWLVVLVGLLLWGFVALVFVIAAASFRRTTLMARL